LGPKFGRLCANEIVVALKSTANVKTTVFMVQFSDVDVRKTGKAAVVFLRFAEFSQQSGAAQVP
jgi:hypothetical protein